jgi:hypothetical protein
MTDHPDVLKPDEPVPLQPRVFAHLTDPNWRLRVLGTAALVERRSSGGGWYEAVSYSLPLNPYQSERFQRLYDVVPEDLA